MSLLRNEGKVKVVLSGEGADNCLEDILEFKNHHLILKFTNFLDP